MGTGKSATITKIVAEMYAREWIDAAVIVTSNLGLMQFRDQQLPQWMPKEIRYRAARISHAAGVKRSFTNLSAGSNGRLPLLVGFAGPGDFQSKRATAKILNFVQGCGRNEDGTFKVALYIDESQNFKGWSSERLKNILTLRLMVSKVYLFSGEPQPNGLEDLFSQFYILDENILGHRTKQSFENAYVVKGGYKLAETVGYKNLGEFVSKTSRFCEYIKISDIHDMPPQISDIKRFEVTPQQRDLYEQVKREMQVEVERALNENDVEIIRRLCKNAASKLIVMAQISNGFFYTDLREGRVLDETGETAWPEREIIHLSDARAEFVIEEMLNGNIGRGTGGNTGRSQAAAGSRGSDSGDRGKTIIFCRFHHDVATMCKVLEQRGIKHVQVHGRLSLGAREVAKLAFQSGELDSPSVMVATTPAANESLNLQIANQTIYYSNGYNYGHRSQSERRTWRLGQDRTCYYYDIVGLPIDRMILKNLEKKENLSEQVRLASNMAKMIGEL